MRRRYRTVSVLMIYGVVIAVAALYKLSGEIDINEFAEDLLAGSILVAVFAVILFSIYVFISRRRNRELSKLKDFPNAPWLYDRGEIEIVGKIEAIFSTTATRKFELFINETLRSLTLNGDKSNRSPQQKFLISSPELRNGERLLIVHNEHFGRVSLKKGGWVSVRGEYVHRRSPRKSFFGTKLTFYGLLHFTHDPKGFVRLVHRPDGERPTLIVHSKQKKNSAGDPLDPTT